MDLLNSLKTNKTTTILIKKGFRFFFLYQCTCICTLLYRCFHQNRQCWLTLCRKSSQLALASNVEQTGTWQPVADRSDLGLIDHSGGRSFISRTDPSEPPAHRQRGGEEIGVLSEMSHEQVWGGESRGDGTRGLGSNTADHSGMEPKPQERTECWPVSTRVCCSH